MKYNKLNRGPMKYYTDIPLNLINNNDNNNDNEYNPDIHFKCDYFEN